jgi:hypothetical protein
VFDIGPSLWDKITRNGFFHGFSGKTVHNGVEFYLRPAVKSKGTLVNIVLGKKEVLVGMIALQNGFDSSVIWAKNHFLAVANRDYLHHYFFYKINEENKISPKNDKKLYVLIKNDL